jgi:hypothetical protein
MSFSQVVDRARAHFTEMPGLELTLPEAVRLLGFGVDDCRYVIDALVDAGFLRWTARRTVVRTTPCGIARPSLPERLNGVPCRHPTFLSGASTTATEPSAAANH